MPKPVHAQNSSTGEPEAAPGEAPEGTIEPFSNAEIRRMDQEERQLQELVFEIATEDPTETDHLAGSPGMATARLKVAAAELIRATLALALRLMARMFVALAGRGVHKNSRAKTGGVKLSLLSLDRLLGSFVWRRIAGRRLALRMLGGRTRKGEAPESITSLKLAGRSYKSGQTPAGLGYAAAANTPVIRVILGVSVTAGERPVYRIRRFAEIEPGGFRELAGYHSTDPEEAFRQYRSHPTVEQMLAASQGESLAPEKAEQSENTEESSRAA